MKFIIRISILNDISKIPENEIRAVLEKTAHAITANIDNAIYKINEDSTANNGKFKYLLIIRMELEDYLKKLFNIIELLKKTIEEKEIALSKKIHDNIIPIIEYEKEYAHNTKQKKYNKSESKKEYKDKSLKGIYGDNQRTITSYESATEQLLLKDYKYIGQQQEKNILKNYLHMEIRTNTLNTRGGLYNQINQLTETLGLNCYFETFLEGIIVIFKIRDDFFKFLEILERC